jgi:hypothetical protein
MPNVNKVLSEWMGKCDHELSIEKLVLIDNQVAPSQLCEKCNKHFLFHKADFSPSTNSSDFFELLEYVNDHDNSYEFDNFLYYKWSEHLALCGNGTQPLLSWYRQLITDRPKFCEAVADYFIPDWRTK